jgi:hypothetical protein
LLNFDRKREEGFERGEECERGRGTFEEGWRLFFLYVGEGSKLLFLEGSQRFERIQLLSMKLGDLGVAWHFWLMSMV